MKTETVEEFLARGGEKQTLPYIKPNNSQMIFARSNGFNGQLISFWSMDDVSLYFGSKKQSSNKKEEENELKD